MSSDWMNIDVECIDLGLVIGRTSTTVSAQRAAGGWWRWSAPCRPGSGLRSASGDTGQSRQDRNGGVQGGYMCITKSFFFVQIID